MLRRELFRDLQLGRSTWSWVDTPSQIAQMVDNLSCAEVRTGLVLVATRCQANGALPVQDTRLWIESAGLRGIRISVRELAEQLRLSARQAHRRIRHGDDVVAHALNDIPRGGFRSLVRSVSSGDRSDQELIETARAECYLLPEPDRALDALRMYRRNRQSAPHERVGSTYLAGKKDVRYRDAKRVATWMNVIATDPPIPSTTAAENLALTVCHGVELAADPHEALTQVYRAIWTQQRKLLPLLLAHAGRLIPDVGAAGVDAWLNYLLVRFQAAMESEHIVALRYARALQVDAARYSPRGIADPRVRRGITGRGHILQMFGHYDAALQCYAQAIQHATHFQFADDELADAQLVYGQAAHDAHAQLVYTEALRQGSHVRAVAALRRVHVIADSDERIELQFTRERRALEFALAFAVRRQDLVIAPPSRREAANIEDQFRRFTELAMRHPSPNRQLSAHDITLLYAVLTRDAGLAAAARNAFQRVNDTIGGYSNLSDRFNTRLRTAKELSNKFDDIAEVRGPIDPLRNPLATPIHPTGLLVNTT